MPEKEIKNANQGKKKERKRGRGVTANHDEKSKAKANNVTIFSKHLKMHARKGDKSKDEETEKGRG